MELNDIQRKVLSRIIQKSEYSTDFRKERDKRAKKHNAYIDVIENGKHTKRLNPVLVGYNNYANLVTLYENEFPDIDFSNDIEAILCSFKKEGIILDYGLILDGSRRLYEISILNNSNELKNVYLEPTTAPSISRNGTGKIEIHLSEVYGIFTDKESKKPSYNVSRKRLLLINALRNGRKTSSSLLDEGIYTGIKVLSRQVKEINKLFIKKLSLSDPLILGSGGNGYSLNRERYEINWLPS